MRQVGVMVSPPVSFVFLFLSLRSFIVCRSISVSRLYIYILCAFSQFVQKFLILIDVHYLAHACDVVILLFQIYILLILKSQIAFLQLLFYYS